MLYFLAVVLTLFCITFLIYNTSIIIFYIFIVLLFYCYSYFIAFHVMTCGYNNKLINRLKGNNPIRKKKSTMCCFWTELELGSGGPKVAKWISIAEGSLLGANVKFNHISPSHSIDRWKINNVFFQTGALAIWELAQ